MNAISNAAAAEIDELEMQVDALHARLAMIETANEEAISWEMHKRLGSGEVPLKVWREHRGLTVAGLAEAAAVTPSQLAAYEAGGPELGLLAMARIARVLRLGVDDLIPPQPDLVAAE